MQKNNRLKASMSQRLLEFILYKGFSVHKFSNIINVSNSYLNKAVRDNISIGSDKIMKIGETFPDLNIEWLLMGRGEMIKKENKESATTSNNDTVNRNKSSQSIKEKDLCAFLKELLSEERKTVDLLNQEIGALKYELELQKKETASLRTRNT